MQPVATGESGAVNTAVGAALGPASQFLFARALPAAAKLAKDKIASLIASKEANAAGDTALAGAKAAGYVVPPTQAKPSLVNRTLESASGKAQTQQAASVKNQDDDEPGLVRQDLGLPENTPITEATLQSIRTQSGRTPIRR
jgi:hypothetical protein